MPPSPVYLTESSRLRIRQVTLDDLPFLTRLFSNPVAMKFFPGLRDEAQTRLWIDAVLESYRRHGYGKWMIERKSDQEPLGHTGLMITSVDGVDEIELGYFLEPQNWGQGYAIEAAKAVLDLAYHRYGFKRVISAIRADNLASIRVAEKLGMKHEKSATASAIGYTWKAEIYATRSTYLPSNVSTSTSFPSR